MADEKHDRFFDLLETVIDKTFNNEPRLQKIEFRTTVMWWVSGVIIVSLGIPLVLHLLKKLIG